LKNWILCLYLMGLNLSNEQIAQELDLSSRNAQAMTSQLRAGIVSKKPVELSGEVETDEGYITERADFGAFELSRADCGCIDSVRIV